MTLKFNWFVRSSFWTQSKKFAWKFLIVIISRNRKKRKYFTHLWRQWPCLLKVKSFVNVYIWKYNQNNE